MSLKNPLSSHTHSHFFLPRRIRLLREGNRSHARPRDVIQLCVISIVVQAGARAVVSRSINRVKRSRGRFLLHLYAKNEPNHWSIWLTDSFLHFQFLTDWQKPKLCALNTSTIIVLPIVGIPFRKKPDTLKLPKTIYYLYLYYLLIVNNTLQTNLGVTHTNV